MRTNHRRGFKGYTTHHGSLWNVLKGTANTTRRSLDKIALNAIRTGSLSPDEVLFSPRITADPWDFD